MNVKKIAAFSYMNKGGNPAGVIVSETMLIETEMLSTAKEVGYSESIMLKGYLN